MELIYKVSVQGLRSIQDREIDKLGGVTTLVGKNSSGKSNVLRALNLFFNDEIEPGKPLDFARDYYVPASEKSKKKKRIAVSVTFRLPQNFHFPQPIAATGAKLGTSFTISRRWELDRQKRIVDNLELEGAGPDADNPSELARQFLNLITYRYIPNRTVPALVLRDESRSLAKSLQIRLKGDTSVDDLLDGLQNAAQRLLKPISRSLKATGAPLENPEVSAPTDLGELLTVRGFQATSPTGSRVRDEDWGSGHQAFFLYQLLYALDTHYSLFFGWKQATIWGVEEPESGLHRDLETRLAQEFRLWVADLRSKIQIIQTTHSPIFTMASDRGFWVFLEDGSTRIQSMDVPELVRSAEIRGVSGWIQPILAFPTSPVVLVEGELDVEALYHVSSVAGDRSVRFLSLPQLDPAEKGAGKDSILTYLKRHSALISNRPPGAPLVVVFDWEVSDDHLNQARSAYGAGADGTRRVVRMNSSYCDPRMSKNFKGIERFYPTRIVEDAVNADEFLAVVKTGKPISIAADQLSKAKRPLLNRLKQTTDQAELDPLVRVWKDIKAAFT